LVIDCLTFQGAHGAVPRHICLVDSPLYPVLQASYGSSEAKEVVGSLEEPLRRVMGYIKGYTAQASKQL
jgi:hypothetical protein